MLEASKIMSWLFKHAGFRTVSNIIGNQAKLLLSKLRKRILNHAIQLGMGSRSLAVSE